MVVGVWPRMRRLALVSALAIGLGGCSGGGGPAAPGSTESPVGPGTLRPGTFLDGSVRLGASESELIAAFGAPVATFRSAQPADGALLRIDHFIRCVGVDRDGLIVVLEGDKTALITRQMCGALPSAQARQKEARQFFPPDSSPRGVPFTTTFGQSATRYMSRTLADALPSSWFRDCNVRSVAPGTFSLVLTTRGWQLVAGTCP